MPSLLLLLLLLLLLSDCYFVVAAFDVAAAFKGTDTELALHIAAPARDGAANNELLEYLAYACLSR